MHCNGLCLRFFFILSLKIPKILIKKGGDLDQKIHSKSST